MRARTTRREEGRGEGDSCATLYALTSVYNKKIRCRGRISHTATLPAHHTLTTADGSLNHLTTLHHFRFRSSGNPAFSCPPHFLLLSLMHSLSLSPKSLHASHTLFCHEVHRPSSRSRCGLASKRTQNLRAILLLYRLMTFNVVNLRLQRSTSYVTVLIAISDDD